MPHPSTIVHLDDLGQAEPTAFGFRTEDYPRLDRVQNVISGVCGCIAGVSIVVLCVLTCAEVFMRAAFHSPLGWNVSVTEKYLIPAIAFFGLVTAYRTGSHIAVASLFAKFPAKVRKALLILIHVLVLVVLLVAVVAGWNITMTAADLGQKILPGLADVATSDWTFRAIVPVSAALGVVVVAIDLYRELASPWDMPHTDYDPGEEG
jgi:TRAP-type C4-dicarboxylate transport system permease small subunit